MLRLYNQRGKPEQVAVYSSPLMPEGDIYMFISPAACEMYARILKAYRVRPCEEPGMEAVKLIMGKHFSNVC